jgi:hypothetical protein
MARHVKLAGLSAVIAFGFATNVSANTMLFEDFENVASNTLSLTTLPGFTVTGSTVDVVGQVNSWGITTTTGNVVDLDGTPGPATIISSPTSFSFNAGDTITLSLLLGGAQRGSVSDDFILGMTLGGATPVSGTSGTGYFSNLDCAVCTSINSNSFTYYLSGSDPFVESSFSFTALTAGAFGFSFGTTSSDNVGPLIDNVSLNISPAVPEPSTWAMLILGFFGIGFMAYRKRSPSIRWA